MFYAAFVVMGDDALMMGLNFEKKIEQDLIEISLLGFEVKSTSE